MHLKKFSHLPVLCTEIEKAYTFVMAKQVLPSMRSMQFAGKAIEVTPNRLFNCAYAPIDDYRVFGELMFLLLSGCGVGYSVQKHHVAKLPVIRRPLANRTRRFLIGDSIEGWADAIKALVNSYYKGSMNLRFDFSDIRAKGERLVTSGGKAPGPQPLKECLIKIEGILDGSVEGTRLKTLEVHDICCHIADAVLAGGIRRAALIATFSADDEDMLSCKSGKWYELNPQRGRANNSVVLLRHRLDEATFRRVFTKTKNSGCGEPGILLSNDKEQGVNPCVEVSLKPFQFCNLVEINVSDVVDQHDLNARANAASFIGTLQASYTDFHYLRPIWKRTTEKEALIGVSMTGIASGGVLKLDLVEAANIVNNTNELVADSIGINRAARTCVVKPAGTTSLVLGTSSGIHAWHSKFYFRRLRVGKGESIYKYLSANIPQLLEDCEFSPHSTSILSIPQKAPEGAITRDESALDLLERVKRVNNEWVKTGHRSGANRNNVSATISIKDDEWDSVEDWMWENRASYNGLSILPYDGGTYVQAPFEECTEEEYERMLEAVNSIDLDKVYELTDETDLSGEIACGGGSCEVI